MAGTLAGDAQAPARRQPNFIVILADDQGYGECRPRAAASHVINWFEALKQRVPIR